VPGCLTSPGFDTALQKREGITLKILLTEKQVHEGVARMADEINQYYGDQPLTVVAVLTGSVVLLADLIRLLPMPLRVGVVQASSYKGATTRGDLTVDAGMLIDIQDRDVLVIDDIFDTGHTMVEVTSHLQQAGAASVCSAVLLQKKGRQEVTARPTFTAFHIPDEFVVGYGLDYQDHYRNLPYIGVLEEEIA